MDDQTPGPAHSTHVVPLAEATRTWFGISLQTFGGPAGQIAVMQHTLVDQKRWLGQQRFQHALSYCMLLPGPEAHQLAIYTGWLLNGTLGGLIAGVLFVLPGALAIGLLSALYVGFGETPAIAAIFAGLAPAVVAIVAQAVHRVGKRSLSHSAHLALAIASFVALALFAVPFPVVILAAGVAGWVLSRRIPSLQQSASHGTSDGPAPIISDATLHQEAPNLRRGLVTLVVGGVLWLGPILAMAWAIPSTTVFSDQGWFFAGTAVVTFGGAYAVLPYVAQHAVNTFGWLAPGEMLRGLALAESTPGPLIMIVQFVAFLGAFRNPGALDPWVAAVLASGLVTWVTFVPSFLFVFLGAPYVERLRGNQHLTAVLNGISAAVVGVVVNLGLYLAVHALFLDTNTHLWGPIRVTLPELTSLDAAAFALTVVCCYLVFWKQWSPLRVLAVGGFLGLVSLGLGVR